MLKDMKSFVIVIMLTIKKAIAKPCPAGTRRHIDANTTWWRHVPARRRRNTYTVRSRRETDRLYYKYLLLVYRMNREICHEGHWSASRGLPSDAEQWSRVKDFLSTPYTHDRYFFVNTFCFTTFDFQRRTCYKVLPFPLKSFYSSLKKPTLTATAVRLFTFTSN